MGLDRSPEQLLKAGLAALKRKDHGRAIATFTQLCQTDGISTRYRLKAQMGLIRTYEDQGAYQQARDLCQPLLKSQSQSIRQWTHDKLEQLELSLKELSTQPSTSVSETTQVNDFVPEASGFIPFTPKSQATTTTPSPVSHPIDDLTDSNSSLFHYQTLNSNRELDLDEKHSDNKHLDEKHSDNKHLDEKHSDNKHSDNKSVLDQNFRDNKSHINSRINAPSQVDDSLPKSSVQRHSEQQQESAASTLSISNGPDTWPQGERLRTLKYLGKVNSGRLWFAQMLTVPLLFVVIRWLLQTILTGLGNCFQFLDQLLPIDIQPAAFFWANHTWTTIIGLSIVTLAAPWLWQWLLPRTTNLPSQQLQTHSPEAVQLLRRLCQKRRWPLPSMHLLASDLPIIFSYGWRPRFGHLVISQGLLECLDADELAAIVIYEMSHWSSLDWVVFSAHGLLLQGCHRAYWFLAKWGEARPIFIHAAAGALATVNYGIFWLLAQVGCGLSRTRTPYRDRRATELTGNPNGLLRALAKLSAAMEKAVIIQGYTPPLLESLALMLPVGPSDVSSIQHLAWGAANPLRHWLSVNQGHPPLGDRLYTLGAYGRHWRLKPSLNVAQLRSKKGARALNPSDWQNLILQGGVWSGLVLGLGGALAMWMIGAIATSLDYPLLAWLYQDRSILISMPLISAATIQILRINRFFPEIETSFPINESQLAIWKNDPNLIPLNSPSIKITGTLTGRPALANWLNQEWRLHTTYGSIRLHHVTYLGPISSFQTLAPLLHQPLQVTGWLRRGYYIWLDIDRLHTQNNHVKPAQHPTWALIISLLLLGYGLWHIFRGG